MMRRVISFPGSSVCGRCYRSVKGTAMPYKYLRSHDTLSALHGAGQQVNKTKAEGLAEAGAGQVPRALPPACLPSGND